MFPVDIEEIDDELQSEKVISSKSQDVSAITQIFEDEINTIHILKAVSDVFQASGTQLFVISFFCLSKKIVKIIFEKENLFL